MADANPISNQNKLLYLFIGIAVLINFSGLLIPIAGPDAAMYATISKTMVQRNDFVQLFYHGADWLGKPHLPFWAAALSFKLFGFTTWAYKLPAILFLMMGAFYTWLFARTLYNTQMAIWSVLILLTAGHIIVSNNDVCAEPYLTGLIIAAVYHFYNAYTGSNIRQLVWACIFTACAIMTKGMFALVPIGGAIAGHLIITRQWRQLFHPRWLIAVILILIFILPELWCLYRQFDLHPEKVVFGQKDISGVRFFFWNGQFGRFFNTGPVRGSGGPFFFAHTVLWAFLPWSFLMLAAVFRFIKNGRENVRAKEWYCIGGALLTFLLLSASSFPLSHYLNIVFPFFAITTAQYLYYISIKKTILAIEITQNIVIALMLGLAVTLHYYFAPDIFSLYTGATLALLLLMLVFFKTFVGLYGYQKVGIRTLLAAFIINLYLNLSFYPSLMKYQAGSEAAFWINKHNPRGLPIAVAGLNDADEAPFEFYVSRPVVLIKNDTGSLPAKPFLLYVKNEELKALNNKGAQLKTLAAFKRYAVTSLSLQFLNKKTRDKELTKMVIVEVN